MNEQYRKEKFESRDEALIWCADNKPIYNRKDDFVLQSDMLKVFTINKLWKDWHKAIEIVPEKRTIEVWVNVYPCGIEYTSPEKANIHRDSGCIGTIKLSKEITIVDGKVVEDE